MKKYYATLIDRVASLLFLEADPEASSPAPLLKLQ